MTRPQIMEQISQLDRQINDHAANNKLPSLNVKHSAFPLPSWISTAFFFAAWLFGPSLPVVDSVVKKEWWAYALYIGILFAIFSLWRTLMWLFKGGRKVDGKYADSMAKVKVLQDQRRELQKQLAEIDKAGK